MPKETQLINIGVGFKGVFSPFDTYISSCFKRNCLGLDYSKNKEKASMVGAWWGRVMGDDTVGVSKGQFV